MPPLYSFLAVLMPLCLVGTSIWRILITANRMRQPQFADVVWLGLYILVNALSGLWALTIVRALQPGFALPEPLLAVSETVGVGLFICFSLVLFGRQLNAMAVHLAVTAGVALKRGTQRLFRRNR